VFWQCTFSANEDRRARVVKTAVLTAVNAALAGLPLEFTIERRPLPAAPGPSSGGSSSGGAEDAWTAPSDAAAAGGAGAGAAGGWAGAAAAPEPRHQAPAAIWEPPWAQKQAQQQAQQQAQAQQEQELQHHRSRLALAAAHLAPAATGKALGPLPRAAGHGMASWPGAAPGRSAGAAAPAPAATAAAAPVGLPLGIKM
jgi:hypothetical protein